jgi:pimeloyl-ACP methyl ester carboxylesterase
MKLPYKLKKAVHADKIELQYNDEGTGQPLLLLHGLFGNLSNWTDTISYFSKSYRVITPVLPIYQASWSKDVLNELVDYVHALITELKLDNVLLLGNSLGGHVSVLYTLAHPEKVSKLILSGSAGLFESNLGVSYPKRGDYNYIADKVKYTFYNEDVVSKALIEEVYDTVNDLKKSMGILRIAKATNRGSVANELGKITTPTLLVWGQQDRVTPPDVAYQFQERLAGEVELHLINNCGHAPMMERPESFNYILDAFLKEETIEVSKYESVAVQKIA